MLNCVTEISHALPLPLGSSPGAARIGPIKTGGRVFVLDHARWTSPMKSAIDGLLQKHRGESDMLKRVDKGWAIWPKIHITIYTAASCDNDIYHDIEII